LLHLSCTVIPSVQSCLHFHQSAQLLLLVSTSLLTGSVSIPAARVAFGQMPAEWVDTETTYANAIRLLILTCWM
jgi:hypothetical protein